MHSPQSKVLRIRVSWILFIGITFWLRCPAQDLEDKLRKPIPELPKADLLAVGMSQDTIQKLIHLINTNPPNDFRGMVVIKDNKLVIEEYFNTYWRETIHDIRSSGKSITALLMGIAIDKGLVKSAEQSIYDFFPKPKFHAPARDKHLNIKIKHLLMMSSGLDADDNNNKSPGRTVNWLTTQEDWVNFAIDLPMSFTPGEKWVYSDVCAMLTGAIIEVASGKKLADFAKENLFTPLGIKEFYWYTASNGRTGPMGNLYISGLDFAKLGLLVLNKGTWQGKQIVSSGWIDEISKKQMDISKIDPFAKSYGYLWYIGDKEVNGKKYEYVFSSGNGGNQVFIVPGENLVVSLTASAYGQGYGNRRSHNLFTYILKSLVQK